ncbi:hypothetical protein DL771_005513 [Monosporascus sp. 5C6A]|nr:hypothetical protein DL771_005513 [Monosporascus sp. 5C6A]
MLKDRSSLSQKLANCACDQCLFDDRRTPRTIFEVSVSQQRLDIIIFSQGLHSDLESLLPIRFGGFSETFDCKLFLKHYTALKTHLDKLRSPGYAPKTTQDLIEEWSLLVDGFLGNRSAFRCFGFQELSDSELLDDQLREVFAQQELEYGIEAFDRAYIETDEREKDSDLDSVSPPADEGDSKNPYIEKEKRDCTAMDLMWIRLPVLDYLLETDAGEDTFEKEIRQKERLRKFRSRFIRQYERLRRVAQNPSTTLYQLSGQLPYHRQAWHIAMVTMRRLSRLKPPDPIGILCFLCVSRAVAETADDDRDAYISAFSQDLEQWRQISPAIDEMARLMWGITFEYIPLPQPTDLQHTAMLQLRDSVARLVANANGMFGLGDWNLHNKTDKPGSSLLSPRNVNQALPDMEFSYPQIIAREKEPPDRLICPATSFLQERLQETPAPHHPPNIITLVTSITFALVVYFMLGFAYLSSIMPFAAFETLNSLHSRSSSF